MGISSYILDLEEAFFDQCENIIKESESVQEAVGNCIKYAKDNWINIHTEEEIESAVDAMWDEFWGDFK